MKFSNAFTFGFSFSFSFLSIISLFVSFLLFSLPVFLLFSFISSRVSAIFLFGVVDSSFSAEWTTMTTTTMMAKFSAAIARSKYPRRPARFYSSLHVSSRADLLLFLCVRFSSSSSWTFVVAIFTRFSLLLISFFCTTTAGRGGIAYRARVLNAPREMAARCSQIQRCVPSFSPVVDKFFRA